MLVRFRNSMCPWWAGTKSLARSSPNTTPPLRERPRRRNACRGGPGRGWIGKTRSAEEFLHWAKSRGADVLKGGASEEAVLPYGLLIEAIRLRMERERAPDDLLEDVWLSELSRLLPELKERYPDLPSPTFGEGEMAKGPSLRLSQGW